MHLNQAPASATVDEDADDEYDIPEELEEILHFLLLSLKDKDTIVRCAHFCYIY